MRTHKTSNAGSVMLIVVFTLLVMVPVMMVFGQWIAVHRKGTTQARIHVKEFYAGNTATDVGRERFRTTPPVWNAATPSATFTVRVDSGTVVTTQVRHVGSQ